MGGYSEVGDSCDGSLSREAIQEEEEKEGAGFFIDLQDHQQEGGFANESGGGEGDKEKGWKRCEREGAGSNLGRKRRDEGCIQKLNTEMGCTRSPQGGKNLN